MDISVLHHLIPKDAHRKFRQGGMGKREVSNINSHQGNIIDKQNLIILSLYCVWLETQDLF